MLDRLPLPRVALSGPVVVRPLGDGRLVLDEGRVGDPYGGNKVRKLEWLLGQAQAGGGDIVTIGPAGSHYLLATSVFARRLGLRVHAVAWPQRRSEHAFDNFRATHAHAEQVWPARSMGHAVWVAQRAAATVRVLAGYPAATWGPGGSNALGTLGWVAVGLEVAKLGVPEVWTASGSGGTAAGLRVGLALAGADCEVVAVDVARGGRAVVEWAGFLVSRLLRRHGVTVPPPGPLRVVHEPSPYGEPARGTADAAAPGLDPVYSAKAWAHFEREGRGLFVATANTRPLAPLLQGALPELPPRLAGLLVER